MTNHTNSLHQVFNGNEDGGLKYVMGQSLDEKTLDSIEQTFSEEKGSMLWPDFSDEIMSRADELLNIPLPDVLVRAWRESGILNKYTNKEEYNPEEVIFIELREHTITSDHKPHLDLEINNRSIRKITFEINLEITVKGIILKVQDAKIRQITTGNVKASGVINCEGHEIVRNETEEINLPGTIDLEEGIPIAL